MLAAPDARLGEAAAAATSDLAAPEGDADPPPPSADAPDLAASPSVATDAKATASVRAPAPPLPARLAAPAWIGKLATVAGQAVQVMLGEDGSVRLQTQRDNDGVSVSVHFSDPELQALAGTHAARLRDVLEAHFTAPVRLSLSDGLTADAGASDAQTSGDHASNGSPSGGSSAATAASQSPSPALSSRPTARADGRREWIG